MPRIENNSFNSKRLFQPRSDDAIPSKLAYSFAHKIPNINFVAQYSWGYKGLNSWPFSPHGERPLRGADLSNDYPLPLFSLDSIFLLIL